MYLLKYQRGTLIIIPAIPPRITFPVTLRDFTEPVPINAMLTSIPVIIPSIIPETIPSSIPRIDPSPTASSMAMIILRSNARSSGTATGIRRATTIPLMKLTMRVWLFSHR